MSSLSWPKISLAFVAVLILVGFSGVLYLSATLRPPEQIVVHKNLALPGDHPSSTSTLPDLPDPLPLPGAAQ